MRFSLFASFVACVVALTCLSTVQAAIPSTAITLNQANGAAQTLNSYAMAVDPTGNIYTIKSPNLMAVNKLGNTYNCGSLTWATVTGVSPALAGSIVPKAVGVIRSAQWPTGAGGVLPTSKLVVLLCNINGVQVGIDVCGLYALDLNQAAATTSCPFSVAVPGLLLTTTAASPYVDTASTGGSAYCNVAAFSGLPGSGISAIVSDSKGALYIGCGRNVFRTNDPTTPADALGPAWITGFTAITGATPWDLVFDNADNLWVLDKADNQVAVYKQNTDPNLQIFQTAEKWCSTICGVAFDWYFANTGISVAGIAHDKSGNLFISFGAGGADRPGSVYFFNTKQLGGIYTPPALWAYFQVSTTRWPVAFGATSATGGTMYYDAYQGQLICNNADRLYAIPLLTALVSFRDAMTRYYTTAGLSCTVLGVDCFAPDTMLIGDATVFNFKLYGTVYNSWTVRLSLQSPSATSGNIDVPTTPTTPFNGNALAVTLTLPGSGTTPVTPGLVSITPRVEIVPQLGTTTDTQYLFSYPGAFKVAAQGKLVFGGAMSLGHTLATLGTAPFTYSSGIPMVGVSSRYQLSGVPAINTTQLCRVQWFGLSANGLGSIPAGNTIMGTSNSVNVDYIAGTFIGAQKLLGDFVGGVGCFITLPTFTKAPTHVVTASTTVAASAAFSPMSSFTSTVVPSNLIFSIYPSPAFTVESIPVTVSAAPGYTTFGTPTPTSGQTIVSGTPSILNTLTPTPALTKSNSMIVQATFTPTANLAGAYYLAANVVGCTFCLQPVQIPALLPATITANYVTPPVTATVTLDPATYSTLGVATTMYVKPGGVTATPITLKLSQAGGAGSQITFDDNLLAGPKGTFIVGITSTFGTGIGVGFVSAVAGTPLALPADVANSLIDTWYIWYRAPTAPTTFNLPGVVAGGVTFPVNSFSWSPSAGSFLSALAPAANVFPDIRIRGIWSVNVPATAPTALPQVFVPLYAPRVNGFPQIVFAGPSLNNRNNITISWGFPLTQPTQFKVHITTTGVTNPASFFDFLVGHSTAPAAFAPAFLPATLTPVDQVSPILPIGATSCYLLLTGGAPSDLFTVSFVTPDIVANTGDFVNVNAPSDPNALKLEAFGTMSIKSVPSQLLMLAPSAFSFVIDPIPSATTYLTFTDGGAPLFGTFKVCRSELSDCSPLISDKAIDLSTLVTPYGSNALSSINPLTGGGFIQYTPPYSASASGVAYPALGGYPQIGFAFNDNTGIGALPAQPFNPNYVWRYNDIAAYSDVSAPNQLTMGAINKSPLPPLQGSISVRYMNFDAANTYGVSTTPATYFPATIGVNGPSPAGPFFQYPIGVGGVNTGVATGDAVPLPMNADNTPNGKVLANTRYALVLTVVPPSTALSFSLSYVDDNGVATPGHLFDYNRRNPTAGAFATSALAHNTTLGSFYLGSTFAGNGIDGALSAAPFSLNMNCPLGTTDANGACATGVAWWNIPNTIATANSRLKISITGSSNIQATAIPAYPSQFYPAKVHRWCGLSTSLTTPVKPFSFNVPTNMQVVCNPPLPYTLPLPGYTTAGTINVQEDNHKFAWLQPLNWQLPNAPLGATTFWGAGSTFTSSSTLFLDTAARTAATRTITSATVQNNYPFQHMVQAPTVDVVTTPLTVGGAITAQIAAISNAVGSASYLKFTPTANSADMIPAPWTAITRTRVPLRGSYAVHVTDASKPAHTCIAADAINVVAPFSTGSLAPSVSADSTNRVTVCFYPALSGATPAPFTVSDGITGVAGTDAFAAPLVVADATATVTTTGQYGAINVVPANTYLDPVAEPLVSGLRQIQFSWTLVGAQLTSAQFAVCSKLNDANNFVAPPASGTGQVLYGGCEAFITPTIPANAVPTTYVATGGLEFAALPGATPTLNTVTYYKTLVPVSVTMNLVVPSAEPFFVVGRTYALEVKTASALVSPVQNGLVINLVDKCGAIDANGIPTVTSVPANGQWSSTTLVFVPGQSTKTVYYTPSRICALAEATPQQLVLQVVVSTDAATSPDGANKLFTPPIASVVDVFGAVSVAGLPARIPTSVTSAPVTVSINPPIPAIAPATTTLTVRITDRAPDAQGPQNGPSMGGSFLPSTRLLFSGANSRPQTLVYVAPSSSYVASVNPSTGVITYAPQNGITATLLAGSTGNLAALYKVVPVVGSIYNQLASTVNVSPAAFQKYDVKYVASLFDASQTASGMNPNPSIQGVFFNVVSGASLSASTSSSLSTVSDNVSTFVGNSAVTPGAAGTNVINFNTAFVPGVPFGYFASVGFDKSAVVVNVESSASTIFVNNNGWPNEKSIGGTFGGYVLPNALSGYVTPVFFLTPGLNTFLVAAPSAPLGGTDEFKFGTAAVSSTAYPSADGDGIVYRFTIARDTIMSLNLWVAAADATNPQRAGIAAFPWSASLPRLVATPQFTTGAASLIPAGPNTVYNANVDYAVQNVAVQASFFGSLKFHVSSNVNDIGSQLINMANNQAIIFPLTVPTLGAGVGPATTTVTIVGGGLGPISLNVVRAPRSLYISGTGITPEGPAAPAAPCITRTGTTSGTFTLSAMPNGKPQLPGLVITGSYVVAGSSTPVNLSQAAATTTNNWNPDGTSANYPGLASLTPVAISWTTAQLPISLTVSCTYSGSTVPCEFTGLQSYPLGLCPL